MCDVQRIYFEDYETSVTNDDGKGGGNDDGANGRKRFKNKTYCYSVSKYMAIVANTSES